MSDKQEKVYPLEDKWKDIDPFPGSHAENEQMQESDDATPELPEVLPPQVVYGIHIMVLDNGTQHAEITGQPTLVQLARLLTESLENIRAEFLAEKVTAKVVQAFQRPKGRIVK